MHDAEPVKRLHRGQNIHVDCSATQHTSEICYQESKSHGPLGSEKQVQGHEVQIAAQRTLDPTEAVLLQSNKLEISSQIPSAGFCGSASTQLSCTTNAKRATTYTASAQAQSAHVSGSVAAHKPGAISAEVELTGRQAAFHCMHACSIILSYCPFSRFTWHCCIACMHAC